MKASLTPFILLTVLLIFTGRNASAQEHARKDTIQTDPSNPVLPPPRQTPRTDRKLKGPVAVYREPS
ncbi:MAG TPA: hypothetical protein VHE34_24575 [Puia sp.]|uniref:hypothetical protein n=1 Tax=Puia sp. TaxID=2045100 RepID=UPI002CD9FDD5|nr:hypothetical protein [Puia sp.]HVU98432.1 hypothetical protein [Puia sp.]